MTQRRTPEPIEVPTDSQMGFAIARPALLPATSDIGRVEGDVWYSNRVMGGSKLQRIANASITERDVSLYSPASPGEVKSYENTQPRIINYASPSIAFGTPSTTVDVQYTVGFTGLGEIPFEVEVQTGFNQVATVLDPATTEITGYTLSGTVELTTGGFTSRSVQLGHPQGVGGYAFYEGGGGTYEGGLVFGAYAPSGARVYGNFTPKTGSPTFGFAAFSGNLNFYRMSGTRYNITRN